MVFDIKSIEAVQIMVYSKPRNFLQKLFIHYQAFVNFASAVDPNALTNEKALNYALGQ